MNVSTEFLTVPEIAYCLGISRPKAYELVHKGLIPSYRFDGPIRVKKADFDVYLKKSKRA